MAYSLDTEERQTSRHTPLRGYERLKAVLIGKSRALIALREIILKLSQYNTTVFIQGESGTGKELIAKMLHELSPRFHKKFIAINCAAIPEQLLEALLFGYEKGSFTGADRQTKGYLDNAGGGTLFLDEISETSVGFQAKLLRVLQEKSFYRLGGHEIIPVDVRILSASNQNLERLMHEGKFRADLYYRLNVVKISAPPLRSRKDDIPELANHFLRVIRENLNNEVEAMSFSDETMKLLKAYEWPGNVRELRNAIEHAAIFAKKASIEPKDLPPFVWGDQKEGSVPGLDTTLKGLTAFELKEARRRFEEAYLLELYNSKNHDLKEVSRLAGVDLATVYRKLASLRREGLIQP